MADLMSAALLERDAKVLAAHRRAAPFAGQWTLPVAVVDGSEAAEDAVRRHLRDQFGVSVDEETFIDTVYIEDPDDLDEAGRGVRAGGGWRCVRQHAGRGVHGVGE